MRKSAFTKFLLAGIFAAILISIQTASAEPNLVSWWKFDEGSGSIAYDSAGSNNGTITGATWTGGIIDGALGFDGIDDYVALSSFVVNTNIGTISLWFKTSADFTANYGSQGYLISRDNQYFSYLSVTGNGTVPYGVYGETNTQDDLFVSIGGASPVGKWNHIVVSFYNKTAKTYLNSVLIQTKSITNSSLTLIRIGGRTQEFFNGKIDDVRIYNKALSAGEILQLYQNGFEPGKAFTPKPANGATGVNPDIVLSWSPGKDAASHDVYFGTDYNDVNDANQSSPEYKGNFDVNNFDPCGFDIGTTYYWRIDEVNEPNLWKGNVWSFKTGDELYVPSEYTTIQAAINAALGGDFVIVASGTYTGNGNRDLDFGGKAITVRGTDPEDPSVVAATVIDCGGSSSEPHRGFYFHSGEGSGSVVAGLTIKNGYSGNGGGIYCYQSSPTISHCSITGNTASGTYSGGGGIWGSGGDYNNYVVCKPVVVNCLISSNSAAEGGGIFCSHHCNLEIRNCLIVNNSSASVGGSGFYFWDKCNVTIANCTIIGNSGGGEVIYSDYWSDLIVNNSILWNDGWPEIVSGQYYPSTCTVSYSDVQGGYIGTGNIDADPMLALDGYHLHSADSPCVNAGNPSYSPAPGETDIDGESRVISGRIDIGADEFNSEEPFIDVSPIEFEFSGYWNGSDPNDQILSIRNSGSGILNWHITEDCNWLEVEPNSGSSSGGINEVTLSIDTSGLSPGSYDYELTIIDDGASNSPQKVKVNLVVTGIVIGLSRTQFEFTAIAGGANPTNQILGISNIGTDTLNWRISESCNWLSIEPNSGSSTGEIDDVNLIVDISDLSAGFYTCELTVSDPCATNNPQTVGVTLYVDTEGILFVPKEYGTIQAAIDASVNGNTVIIVPGTYTAAGNYNLDFGGKAITVRSIDPEDPCVVAATVIDCQNTQGRRGFYFHSGEDANSVLEGVTIQRGNIYNGNGGGIWCGGASSPTIKNCVITLNRVDGQYGNPDGGFCYGGGIYCTGNSSPLLVKCIISNNTARGGNGANGTSLDPAGFGGNAYGGGIHVSSGSVTITDCVIKNNTALGGRGGSASFYPAGGGGGAFGGGAYNISIIRDSIITNNVARRGLTPTEGSPAWESTYGGGICYATTINNCLIINNSVDREIDDGWYEYYGGGIYSGSVISNCTIYGNTVVADGAGGGVAGGTVINSILWANTDDIYNASAMYSDIEDGDTGPGNIQSDPCFVTGPYGDYYLSQIAAGQAFDSPCVDAGNNTAANLGMNLFTTRTDEIGDGGVVDMGYHYSMPNPADIDGDGDVDFVDYAILASQWQQAPGEPSADIAPLGGDGIVNNLDLGVLTDNWLEGF